MKVNNILYKVYKSFNIFILTVIKFKDNKPLQGINERKLAEIQEEMYHPRPRILKLSKKQQEKKEANKIIIEYEPIGAKKKKAKKIKNEFLAQTKKSKKKKLSCLLYTSPSPRD